MPIQASEWSRENASTITVDGLSRLIAAVAGDGYRMIGPRFEAGAIVLGQIDSLADLPAGRRDVQQPGHYRTGPVGAAALFAHAAPAATWKRFLYPPVERLWRARRSGAGFALEYGPGEDDPGENGEPPLALFAIRACDLAAIGVLDEVLTGSGRCADARYRARRERALVVAVDCAHPAADCFCASMGTGPRVAGGFDLVISELAGRGGDPPRLLIASATPRGAALLGRIERQPAERRRYCGRRGSGGRGGGGDDADDARRHRRHILARNLEHPHWDEVAGRCLGCANCTMVCPTCFCATVEDTTDLSGDVAERTRLWDSCFTVEHSYIHGGAIRTSAAARYRQWMAHKLSTWHEQFGTSGCVGCGRCITWCPVGIDITEEACAIPRRGGRALTMVMVQGLEAVLREHPFFAGLDERLSRARRRLRRQRGLARRRLRLPGGRGGGQVLPDPHWQDRDRGLRPRQGADHRRDPGRRRPDGLVVAAAAVPLSASMLARSSSPG